MSKNLPSRPVNQILAALPKEEYQRLIPDLTTVTLSMGTVLYEASEKIETVYFPDSALISLVSILENGSTTEVGLVGINSIIGLSVILGSTHMVNRAIVQIAGSAKKIAADALKREFSKDGKLQMLLLLCAQIRINEVSQLAVCNRHHSLEERLARWLLQVRDLIQSDKIPLTQEFIAKMLGVRRSGVTVAAQSLQKAGAIGYSRGNIMILNVGILQNICCECYAFQKSQYQRLFSFRLDSINNDR